MCSFIDIDDWVAGIINRLDIDGERFFGDKDGKVGNLLGFNVALNKFSVCENLNVWENLSLKVRVIQKSLSILVRWDDSGFDQASVRVGGEVAAAEFFNDFVVKSKSVWNLKVWVERSVIIGWIVRRVRESIIDLFENRLPFFDSYIAV